MTYKISKANLKRAISEAVEAKKNNYKNLAFVNTILKEYTENQKAVKNIIKNKRDGGKILYKYLLKECGCGSRYNKLAEYVDYKNEEELLYDEPMNEYSDPYDDEFWHDDTERWDHFDWDESDLDDEALGILANNEEASIRDIDNINDSINEMPKYWVAEKDGKKRYSECSSLTEETVREEVKHMEKNGYKLTAFKNEADMKEYLKGS